MKLPAYPRTKPSGVEWLGDIAGDWSVSPIKHLVSTPVTDGPHETPEIFDEGIPFVSAEAVSGGQINFERIRGHITAEDHKRFSRKYKPRRGDIYLIKSGATTGRVAMVETDIEFNIWSPLAAIRCEPKKADRQFLFFYLQSKEFQTAVELSWSFGTQQNIGMGVIQNLAVPLPSLAEQRAIAAFLDRETGRVDRLVAKKRELIERLKEKRTALISRTVTRGLPPAAARAAGLPEKTSFKPSGLDWLGDIPKHWEVKRLKFVSPHITVGIVVEPSKYYADEGIPALRSLNVKPHRLVANDLVFITPTANEQHAKSKIYEGDLVAVRSGQPGTTAVVDKRFHGANCIDLIIIRKPHGATSAFLDYFLNSDMATAQFETGTGGAIQQHFNITMAASLQIIVPPLPEQAAIVAYLATETTNLDALVGKVEEAVERLQEYRTALITAAVTGKIDVRTTNQP